MQMDKDVKRLLAAVRQPYDIVKKVDHYFLRVPGHPPFIIASNGKKHSRNTTYTLHALRRVIDAQRGL